MSNLAHSPIGFIHLLSSILALVFGTHILLAIKGTKIHKKVGYAYFISMVILNATAFMIYGLFGTFHMFHVAAIVSTLTLFFGMYPVIFKSNQKWLTQHLSFMYWSVIGLYSAFWSEVFTRLVPKSFMWMVGIATFLTIGIGTIFFVRIKNQWKNKSLITKH